jgi:cytochrome c peroxidase
VDLQAALRADRHAGRQAARHAHRRADRHAAPHAARSGETAGAALARCAGWRRAARWLAAALATGIAGLAATGAQAASREALQARARAVLGVLPADAPNPENPFTPEKIDLGRMLYYENRMSINEKLSCNSCHDLANFGVDNEPTSPGHEGKRGARNSPTVYNAALHVAQFWDGRAKDVEEQAKGPVLNPVEMGMPDADYVVKVLRAIPGYHPLFAAAFPGEAEPITYDNVARAIGAFERKLMTPSRFDDFLNGQLDALSDAELAGLETFLDVGCTTCHMGAPVGGLLYQKLGLVHPYETKDLGRYEVTKNEVDRHFFKVPSLRNVEKTGPYFHDGSVATLPEAVRLMAWHQLGKQLSDADVASIVTFLGALTGRVDEDFVAKPALP